MYCDDFEEECWGGWSEVAGISYYKPREVQFLKICNKSMAKYNNSGWITLVKIGTHQIFYISCLT